MNVGIGELPGYARHLRSSMVILDTADRIDATNSTVPEKRLYTEDEASAVVIIGARVFPS